MYKLKQERIRVYKTKTVYETQDGKRHDTKKAAADHIENIICDKIIKIITPELLKRGLSIYDAIPITEKLWENRKEIFELLQMEYYGDNGFEGEDE